MRPGPLKRRTLAGVHEQGGLIGIDRLPQEPGVVVVVLAQGPK